MAHFVWESGRLIKEGKGYRVGRKGRRLGNIHSTTRPTMHKDAITIRLENLKLYWHQAYKNENAAEQASTKEEKLNQYYLY